MKVALPMVLGVVCVIAANLLLKVGVGAGGRPSWGLAFLLNWRVLGALVLFAMGFAFYALVLRRLPLNVAQGLLAAQLVGVVLGSHLILGEALPGLRVLGIGLITLGIVVVAWSQA